MGLTHLVPGSINGVRDVPNHIEHFRRIGGVLCGDEFPNLLREFDDLLELNPLPYERFVIPFEARV